MRTILVFAILLIVALAATLYAQRPRPERSITVTVSRLTSEVAAEGKITIEGTHDAVQVTIDRLRHAGFRID